MKNFLAWVKEHPLTIVLIVGVGILALVLLSGGGGGSTQTAQVAGGGPSDAAIAASTSLQEAQLQANTQTQGINASVVAQTNQQSFQLAEDQINANTAQYQTKLGADVSLAGIDAQQNVQLAGIAAGVQTADLQNQASLAQAGIYRDIFTAAQTTEQVQANDNAYVAINGQNVQGSIANNQITTAGNVAINGQNVQGQIAGEQIAGATQVALAPYTLAANAINSGKINLGTKDSYINLPGVSLGRATNFTPPGATQGQPSALSGFLTNIGAGIGNSLPLLASAFG